MYVYKFKTTFSSSVPFLPSREIMLSPDSTVGFLSWQCRVFPLQRGSRLLRPRVIKGTNHEPRCPSQETKGVLASPPQAYARDCQIPSPSCSSF